MNIDLGIVLLSEVLSNIENDIIPVNTDEGANFQNLIGQVVGDKLTDHRRGDYWLVSTHSNSHNYYILFEQKNNNHKVIICIPYHYYQKVIEQNMELSISNRLVESWDDIQEGKTVITNEHEQVTYIELNKAFKVV